MIWQGAVRSKRRWGGTSRLRCQIVVEDSGFGEGAEKGLPAVGSVLLRGAGGRKEYVDDEGTRPLLHKAWICPLIRNRSLRKEQPERMLPGHDGRSNMVYDESGTLYRYESSERAARAAPDELHQARTETGDGEVPLPGETREVEVPEREALQRGKGIAEVSAL